MTPIFDGNDDAPLTRREAREHRQEMQGVIDEAKRLLAEIKVVRDVIDRIKVRPDEIAFKTGINP